MAEIKIIGNITSTTNVTRFKDIDTNLVTSRLYKNNFGFENDYIEYFIYDVGETLLNSNYNYLQYKSSTNVGLNPDGTINYIEIDPVEDLKILGYVSGEFISYYNFFRKKIGNINEGLFIKNISSDRTEIAIASTKLSNTDLEIKVNELISEINTSTYFKTYLANYGLNQQLVIVNVALDKTNENQYLLLLKLYEPLTDELIEKDQLWIVDEIVEPYVFDINLDKLIIPDALPQLRGPNFEVKIPDQNTISTKYQSQNSSLNVYQSLSSASYNQILSYTTSQSIDINVDYSNFSNFTKFSSAEDRILNFYYKVKDIESNKNIIDVTTPKTVTTASLLSIVNKASASITDTISNFDGFEYYLYFESGSTLTSSINYSITPYPKLSSTKPFTLYSTGSALSFLWLAYATSSAQKYDNNNQEWLKNIIPQYIVEDTNNDPYITFTNMIGHYFDNVWIYLKSVTDLYKSYNNLEDGVSKDLVYYALRSLGAKTYNSKEGDNLNSYLIGTNSGSVNFVDDFSYTSSYLNNVPTQDLLTDSFKRMYHNVSLLFKSKGTYYGLDSINNIFGITSSILDAREYGGILKSDYLKGYTTDKIRTSDLGISGSILSPYISVQLQETASNLIRNLDYHRLDIAFSPQNQIDTRISSSIATLYPSFSIDDIIGDPRINFSSSYVQLVATASRVFSSSFTYAFDYAGFTRLIRYFDNTLFKTTEDYVPGRANLSTGVLLRSPQIERNKVKQTQPLFNTESIQEATYSIADISEDNDYLYSQLPGDRAAFYTGQLSGSIPSINYYFEYTNPNPYLITSNKVILPSLTGSATYSFNDSNRFNHTDFNVLFNNVSSSILSIIRKKLEPIYSITGSNITIAGYSSSYYAELQDSYLELKTYNLSRYEGVKLTSMKYNSYTSASTGYIGDISYGKTAAIDKQVRKLGLFSQVISSSYLPKRNNTSLKYLVDEFGGLTDLNQRNKHWEEVQRTFIANDYLNVAQFDNQKYSNQKTTDGSKLIFDSGYSYYPILYFKSCSEDSKIYFENSFGSSAYRSTAKNITTPLTISGSSTIGYPLSASYVKNIFNTVIEGAQYFTGGTTNNFPTYSVQETGDHIIQASFDITMDISGSSQSATWSLQVFKNNDVSPLYESEYIFYTAAPSGTAGSLTASLDNSNSGTAIFNVRFTGVDVTVLNVSSLGTTLNSTKANSTGPLGITVPTSLVVQIQKLSNGGVVLNGLNATIYINGALQLGTFTRASTNSLSSYTNIIGGGGINSITIQPGDNIQVLIQEG
jgi:hypothetical protein